MIFRIGLFQAQFETNNDPGYFKPYYVIFTDYKVKMVNGPRRTSKNFDTLEEAVRYVNKVLEIETELDRLSSENPTSLVWDSKSSNSIDRKRA